MSFENTRVLLVDDSAEDRQQCRLAVAGDATEGGPQFKEASTGKEALKMCRSELPDCVIFTDPQKDMAAATFLSELVDDAGQLLAPVVVVLTQRSRKALNKVTDSGATDWLFKDQVGSTLAEKVHPILDRQKVDKAERAEKLKEVRAARKAEEAETGESSSQKTLLRALLTGVPGLLVVKSKKLRYQATNPAFCQFVGKSPEEIIGKTDSDVFGKDDAGKLDHEDQAVLRSGIAQTEAHQVSAHAGPRWINVTRSPLIDDLGETTGLIWSAHDITDFKRLEDAMRDSKTASLAFGEDQTELTCQFKSDGTLTYANEALCRFAGKQRDELLGQGFVSVLPKPYRGEAKERLDTLKPKTPVTAIKVDAESAAGGTRRHRWVLRALFDAGGQLEQYQAVGQDLTAARKAEDELAEKEERIQALQRQVSEAAAGTAGAAQAAEAATQLEQKAAQLEQQASQAAEARAQLDEKVAQLEQQAAQAEQRLAEKDAEFEKHAGQVQELETRLRGNEALLKNADELAAAASQATALANGVTDLMAAAFETLGQADAPGAPDPARLAELRDALQKVNTFVQGLRKGMG